MGSIFTMQIADSNAATLSVTSNGDDSSSTPPAPAQSTPQEQPTSAPNNEQAGPTPDSNGCWKNGSLSICSNAAGSQSQPTATPAPSNNGQQNGGETHNPCG